MAITAITGPYVSAGITGISTNGLTITQQQDYNPQRGPSLFDLGAGMADPRGAYMYQPGDQPTRDVFGFVRGQGVVDFAPSSASSNAFAISSNTAPVAATAFTLTPSSAKGTYSTTIIAPENGQSVSVIAIDSTAAFVNFGQDGAITYWNPAAGTGRCISLTGSSFDGGTITIAGRDMYGYKMTESITASTSGNTVTSQKAFKYLAATGAIVMSTTVASTGYSIGLSDTFGMPLRVDYSGPANLSIAMSTGPASGRITAAVVPTSGTFVFASTATTQTSTMPDVRGTWASSIASNGTNRLQIVVTPPVSQLSGVTALDMSGLFGATQFSSV